MSVIEELLRKTGEFEEKDIKESAKFVDDFVNTGRKVFDTMLKLPSISEMMGLKKNDQTNS